MNWIRCGATTLVRSPYRFNTYLAVLLQIYITASLITAPAGAVDCSPALTTDDGTFSFVSIKDLPGALLTILVGPDSSPIPPYLRLPCEDWEVCSCCRSTKQPSVHGLCSSYHYRYHGTQYDYLVNVCDNVSLRCTPSSCCMNSSTSGARRQAAPGMC